MSIMWKWWKDEALDEGEGRVGGHRICKSFCRLHLWVIYISAMHVIRIACSSEMCQVSIKVKIMQARFSRARNRLNPGTSFNLCIAGFRKPESCPGAPHSTLHRLPVRARPISTQVLKGRVGSTPGLLLIQEERTEPDFRPNTAVCLGLRN